MHEDALKLPRYWALPVLHRTFRFSIVSGWFTGSVGHG
jgi:hypothetical protein